MVVTLHFFYIIVTGESIVSLYKNCQGEIQINFVLLLLVSAIYRLCLFFPLLTIYAYMKTKAQEYKIERSELYRMQQIIWRPIYCIFTLDYLFILFPILFRLFIIQDYTFITDGSLTENRNILDHCRHNGKSNTSSDLLPLKHAMTANISCLVKI